jgi:hypothetical protein
VILKLCSLTENDLADALATALASRMAAISAVRPSFADVRIAMSFL